MSNNEIPTSANRQVPVETYKCSQCNFYTNHEYYLQQHSLTHSLQVLMEQYRRTQNSYDSTAEPQTYIKPHLSHGIQIASKVFRCSQCNFETNQEGYLKEHILINHNVELPIDPYRAISQRNFVGNEENYLKAQVVHNDTVDTSFSSRGYVTDTEVNTKAHNLTQNANSFGIPQNMFLKQQAVDLVCFKCTMNNCTFETPEESELKQHSLSHDLQTPCPEVFKCLQCDFETHHEEDLKQHVQTHRNLIKEESPVVNEIFRCHNCDYETNLKAFLKKHMSSHAAGVKVKVKVEKLKCTQCSFETEHEKFLKRHELSHKDKRHYRCKKCKFNTLYKKMYLKHLKCHKDSGRKPEKSLKKYKCEQCSYEGKTREQVVIHRNLKHPKPEVDINLFKCQFCKYQTNWEPCLKRHIDREHPDQKILDTKVEKNDKETLISKEKVKVKKETPIYSTDKPGQLFRCHHCDFATKNKYYLINHLKRWHSKDQKPEPKRTFKCKFKECDFHTPYRSNLLQHMQTHQNPKRVVFFFCDLCNFISKYEEKVAQHKKKVHLNHLRKVYKCSQCDYRTVAKGNLKAHSAKHKTYTCNVCEQVLDSAMALVKHRRGHQICIKNRIYLCDVCGFQSKNDRSLKMHKKTHNPEFKCPDCPFQTHSKVNYQNHCINHKNADEVMMFPCPHCSYQSRLKRNLAWHMKRHVDPTQAKIFKCPTCEYQTFTNAQLKSHLMVHKSKEEVIMLKCDFCTFETKRKSNMVQHRLRHLKDSPDVPLLSCPDCNYTTVAKRHLNKHRKTHNVNPDKMFQCTYCPYKIHRKVYLMRHMENHKNLENYASEQWQRYTFQPPGTAGAHIVPNLGQNLGPPML